MTQITHFNALRAASTEILGRIVTEVEAKQTPIVLAESVRQINYEVKPLVRTAVSRFGNDAGSVEQLDNAKAALLELNSADSRLSDLLRAKPEVRESGKPPAALTDIASAIALLS